MCRPVSSAGSASPRVAGTSARPSTMASWQQRAGRVFDTVTAHAAKQKQEVTQPLLAMVCGTAGSGKTFLIRAIKQFLVKYEQHSTSIIIECNFVLHPAADHARGAVAAVLPHWSHDDGRLPGGRLTRPLPPPANGHGREVWCERRNRTASARWAPRLPGQPASRLHPHALRRAAFDHFDPDRRGLWARHADTHAQAVLIRRRPIPAA